MLGDIKAFHFSTLGATPKIIVDCEPRGAVCSDIAKTFRGEKHTKRGTGDMKKLGMHSRVLWLLVIVFAALTSNVQSQDVFREMDQIKSEVAKLKTELNDLKSLVYEMRRVVLESATAQKQQTPEKVAPQEEKAAKKGAPMDEEQLTKIICAAVGRFFSEAESALRSSDPSTAETEMNNARQKLTRSLHGYSGTHRVSKLMNIYDGLAWSTYTAVQMRQSITGNEDFLKVLRKHKQRYMETCPKE